MSGALNAAINITVNAVNVAAINAIQGALFTLRTSVNGFANTTTFASRQLTALDNSMRSIDRTMKYILAGSLIGVTHGFIKMMSDMERLGITLGTIENSFEKANIALDRMLVLSQRTPYTLNTIHEAFVKLRASGIEPIIDAQGNGPLKNLLDAVAAFGGGDEQIKRVALAIEQMAGKGVVSMEELRRQMGQQIPTAIRLMAEGMGVSVSKLISDISRGVVQFNDAVPPMLDKFAEKYGGAGDLLATTFSGALRLAGSEVSKFATTLNRAGVLDVLTSAIHLVIRAFRDLNDVASVSAVKQWMSDVMAFADRNADAFVRAIVTVQEFGTAFATIVGALFNAIAQMPSEAVAGGILGWIIFGRVGLVAGAILGPATNVVQGVANAIGGLIGMIATAIGSLGIDSSDMAVYGLIGWLLFGRLGLMVGVLVTIVDKVVGRVREAFANVFGDVAGFMAGMADPMNFGTAFSEKKGSFLKGQAAGDGGFFGFGDVSKTPMQEFFAKKPGGADATAGTISKVSEALATLNKNLAETRQKFDGAFGQVEDIPGVPQSVMKSMERFGAALQGVEARLAGAEGHPIDAWVSRQQDAAEKFEKTVIAPLQASWKKFSDAGDFKNADAVMKSITDAQEQLTKFNSIVNRTAELEKGKTGARIGARAEGVLGRLGNSLQQASEQLDAFEARFSEGKISPEAEAAKAFAQFSPMAKQLDNMKLAIQQLKGAEGDRAAALQDVLEIEERLNRVREMAVQLAIRKASREREDGVEEARRAVRGFSVQAFSAEMAGSMFGGAAGEAAGRQEQAAAQFDAITDKIKEMKRRLEDTPGDSWLARFIEALEIIQGRFQKLKDVAGTTTEAINKISTDLGTSVAGALEDGLGNSIEALITRTKSLGDVVKQMYAEITRAAIQYLMRMALVSAGSPDGTLSGLFGFLTRAGGAAAGAGAASTAWSSTIIDANIPSAMGNVFQKFASGGSFTNSIVRGPTTFPVGLMGEAGPEGIMPLANVGGKLGVHAVGGKGGGDNYTIQISAVDAASVQRLFYENGGALINALRHRDNLNRGFTKR